MPSLVQLGYSLVVTVATVAVTLAAYALLFIPLNATARVSTIRKSGVGDLRPTLRIGWRSHWSTAYPVSWCRWYVLDCSATGVFPSPVAGFSNLFRLCCMFWSSRSSWTSHSTGGIARSMCARSGAFMLFTTR